MKRVMHELRKTIARHAAWWAVRFGRADRICAPGQWKVWRDGAAVRMEVLR